MASSNPSPLDVKSRNLIDTFTRFITKQIALEIVKQDIELAIFLLDKKIGEDKASEIQTGVQLVTFLKRSGLLSENNLDFFIELLEESRRVDLADRVRDYQRTSVKTVKDAHMISEIPVNMESLLLIIPVQPSPMTVNQLDHIKASICKALGLKKSEVSYVATDEDENPLYSQVSFRFPKTEENINQLLSDALNKKTWLTDLEVVELTVDKKSSIKIAEREKPDGSKTSRNGEKQARPPVLRIQSVLALNPALKIHCDQTFDTILAIELSSAVDFRKRRAVLEQCESALQIYHSHHKELLSFRVAAIRFGNHNVVPIRLPDQQQIAFVEKELSSDLKITSKIKPDSYCGGTKNSGLADALSKVYSLREDMHRRATKLCIVICFVTSNSSNPEHYRCCFGYDVIDLGHALAAHAIPLYIIGIDTQARSTKAEENYLLSGLTAITGGRYFQIQDIRLLKELIHCIVKENNSIEKNMGTVNDVVITEIDKQYGDVNDVHLADCLHNSLALRSCEIDCITHRGALLTPISQISERVSWADNLDDAIVGVKSLKEHMKAADKMPSPSRQVPTMQKQSSTSDAKKTSGKKRRGIQKEPKEFATVKLNPDKEVSARMVRRQIERSAYYRPTMEK